ncbi:hypothetical protein ACWEOS_24005 [Micromonospora taraxaci]
MPDDRMMRFQAALEKVREKSRASQSEEATLSLSVTTLQAALDNGDVDKALALFEECADLYVSLEEPEHWMGNRLGQLSSRLQMILKGGRDRPEVTESETLDLGSS